MICPRRPWSGRLARNRRRGNERQGSRPPWKSSTPHLFVDANPGFHYFRVMHTAVATLPEDVARWLRTRVAGDGRSGSGWLADLLEGAQRHEDTHEIGTERPLSRRPHKSEWMGEGNRNELVEIHR